MTSSPALRQRGIVAGTVIWRRALKASLAVLTLAAAFAPAFALSAQDAGQLRPDSLRRTTLGVDVSYANFQGAIDPWTTAAISLSRRSAWGSIIGRANIANRFATSGTQIELDAYPSTGKRSYLYLNAGYSQSSIFPEWRFGGELFANLPNAWEASLGFRQLRFGGHPVTLFTGAVGHYFGNYWASLRPFVRFKTGGTSASAGLTLRRYFEDGDNYIGLRASYGSSPTDNITPDAIARTNSNSFGVHGSHAWSARYLWNWSAGRDEEQLSPTNTRTSLIASVGIKYVF